MKNIFKFNFHLFDGEGGAPAGSGEGSVDGQYGQGASDFLSSLGLSAEDVKPKERPAEEKKPAEGKEEARQVGTDTDKEETPEERFAKMIEGDEDLKKVYGSKVSKAINDRFKNQADLQGQVDQYNDALAPLMKKYGLEAGDIEGLSRAIAQDDDTYRSGAEEAGMDINQYRQRMQLEAEAARGRAIVDAYEEQNRKNQMFAGWQQEAEQLKQAMPNFDLNNEIHSNPRFVQLLNGGASVAEAFAATHANEMFNGYSKEVSQQAQADVINDIKRQAARPPEGALNHSPAAQTRFDPSKISDDEIDDMLRRAQNGEQVKFPYQ